MTVVGFAATVWLSGAKSKIRQSWPSERGKQMVDHLESKVAEDRFRVPEFDSSTSQLLITTYAWPSYFMSVSFNPPFVKMKMKIAIRSQVCCEDSMKYLIYTSQHRS